MLSILAITLPVFLLIGVGFVAGKLGAFTPDQARGLGRFVLNIALPALVFQSLASRRAAEIFQPGFLAVYGIASLLAFAAGFFWFRKVARTPVPPSAIRAMGMSFSNNGFVGLPIMLQLLGPAGAVPVALAMIVENLIMFPLGLSLARAGTDKGTGGSGVLATVLRDLAKTPIILAILLGVTFSLLAVPLPEMLARTIGLLAAASAPVALVATGAGLVGVSLRGQFATMGTIAAGKLLLHPLLVLALLQVIPVQDQQLAMAALVLAGMPMFSVFPVLAQRHGDGEVAGAALLLTTALSFVTISLTLYWVTG